MPSFWSSVIFPGASDGISPDRAPGIGGGMLIGPNDPRWFGRGEIPRLGGVLGAPPGGRFDPYIPPSVPGHESERFVRSPPPPGGGTHQGPDYI